MDKISINTIAITTVIYSYDLHSSTKRYFSYVYFVVVVSSFNFLHSTIIRFIAVENYTKVVGGSTEAIGLNGTCDRKTIREGEFIL